MSSTTIFDTIITARLAACYWNDWLEELLHSDLSSFTPVSYRHERRRENVQNYDERRLKAILRDVVAGQPLDPIEVDWDWVGVSPVRIVVLDGHHRFVAAVRAKLEHIPVSYSGPVDALEWLRGKNTKPPACCTNSSNFK